MSHAEDLAERLAAVRDDVAVLEAQRCTARAEMERLQALLSIQNKDRHKIADKDTIRGRITALARHTSEIDAPLERLKRRMWELEEAHQRALQPRPTAETMQEAVRHAEEHLEAVRGPRGGAEAQLNVALAKRADADAAIERESLALAALEQARADAFLAPEGTAKREAADEAVNEADMALSVAREAAANARAALPRIDAAIAQRRAALEAIDNDIASSEGALLGRTHARDMWEAFVAYEVAQQAVGDAALRIKELDDEKGCALLEALRTHGLRRFNDSRAMELPAWLKNPKGAGGAWSHN